MVICIINSFPFAWPMKSESYKETPLIGCGGDGVAVLTVSTLVFCIVSAIELGTVRITLHGNNYV